MSVNAVSSTGALTPIATRGQFIQYSTMPTASVDLVDRIIQYVGSTNQNYTNGYFYKCVLNGSSYKWENINVSEDSGVIDGSTVTPTNDVQIWLECAGLHQSYTTLSDVLADSAVLSALMASTNAVDYLARSTTWATDICANELAMAYIGANNYCADTLLADSTWCTAICNSTYFKSVLNVKVPKLSNNNNVLYSSYVTETDRQPYYAFDNNYSTLWATPNSTDGYIGYEFANDVCINKAEFYTETGIENTVTLSYKNSSNQWVDTAFSVTMNAWHQTFEIIAPQNIKSKSWRLHFTSSSESNHALAEVQFYGRSDYPIGSDDATDTNADISAIAPNEPNSTASKAYAIGEHFYKNGKFCTAIAAIAQGAQFTLGTNYVEGTVADYTTDLVTTISYQFEQTETAVAAGKFIVIAPQSILTDLTADYKIAWETILPSGTTEKDIIPINLIAANAGAWSYFSNTFNVGSFINNSDYSIGMLKVQNNINRYPTIRLTYLNKKIVKKQFL